MCKIKKKRVKLNGFEDLMHHGCSYDPQIPIHTSKDNPKYHNVAQSKDFNWIMPSIMSIWADYKRN